MENVRLHQNVVSYDDVMEKSYSYSRKSTYFYGGGKINDDAMEKSYSHSYDVLLRRGNQLTSLWRESIVLRSLDEEI